MLFETNQKKPVNKSRVPAARPLQKNIKPGLGMSKPPVRTAVPVQKKPVGPYAVSLKKTAPGQAPARKALASPSRTAPVRRTYGAGQARAVPPRKLVTAGPAVPAKPAVVGRKLYRGPQVVRKNLQTAASPTVAGRRVYRGPLVVRKSVQIPGRRILYPGRSPQTTYTTVNRAPVGYTRTITPRPGRFVPGYGYCTPASPAAQATVNALPLQQPPLYSTPGVVQKPCHTCGSKTKGCTTISSFAFNSSQLRAGHKKQINQLASRILRENINAVIATGHTDSSGSEDYNEALGARRAGAVIRELRKQLKTLKPNAHRELFWKILSRGESQPISKTDAAANRRVHLCVRKAKF
jgi:outer membrane protein OmpA-like peptidoglycan-associated protein